MVIWFVLVLLNLVIFYGGLLLGLVNFDLLLNLMFDLCFFGNNVDLGVVLMKDLW